MGKQSMNSILEV